MGKKTWTSEDEKRLEERYKVGIKVEDLAKEFNKSVSAMKAKIRNLNLSEKYPRKNSVNFKAPYQDYNWCYERYVNRKMSYEEMAQEVGCTKRVIQKWCVEKFGLHNHAWRHLIHLTPIQREIIIAGTFGDGHIARDEDIYIESHAEDEKDYLYWKYEQLKSLCISEPVRIEGGKRLFGNTLYLCQPSYKFQTRNLDDLKELKQIPRIDRLSEFNWLGLCLYLLDDASRSDSNWMLCIASLTIEEKTAFIDLCLDKFGLNCHLCKDTRYLLFDSISSKAIDSKVLELLPNDLDIIQKKIMKWR